MIAGLQKMTLLDYPGKVACTVFLQSCNFRCPFCHNSDLLGTSGPEPMPEEELLAFLQKRKGLLDAVCISGGEPTLYPGLAPLIRNIRELGFLIKLDTNGSRPEVLKSLLDEGLLDYVAMDIKNAPSRYADTAGVPGMKLDKIEQSIRLLTAGMVDYEFRTTVMDELHDEAAMTEMGEWLTALSPDHKISRLFLQPYLDRDSVFMAGLHTPNPEKLRKMADSLAPFVKSVNIRNMA